MNYYDEFCRIILLCRYNPHISSFKITVNMSWEEFIMKYHLDKFMDHSQCDMLYNYKITKLENSFIIGE